MQSADIFSVRPRVLTHILSVESQPLQAIIDIDLDRDRAWDQRFARSLHQRSRELKVTQVEISEADIQNCDGCDEP